MPEGLKAESLRFVVYGLSPYLPSLTAALTQTHEPLRHAFASRSSIPCKIPHGV
jgi:hypothetical protein